jgi:lysophospholipase L1-like esterase
LPVANKETKNQAMKKSGLLIGIFILLIAMTEELYAQDWANLNRFRDENIKLGPPAPGEKRVVFMGNSITEGWSQHSPGFFSGKPYINRGISGQTTPQMLIRFRADVIDLNPEAVIILAGTNDIAGNTGPSSLEMIMDNLISMSELARANTIKVILCSVLPAYDYPWSPGNKPYEKIPAMNNMIKNYAEKNGFIYIDYFSAMVDERNGLKSEYTYDGVHPNEDGYNVMEPLAEKAIAKATGQIQ